MENLYFYGNKNLLTDGSFKLGIVGSRNIISYTKENLEGLFFELRNFDFCIVSGGMYGVDLYAHNLALKHNLKSIFILPQGIESYKRSSLYQQIKFNNNPNYLFISSYPENFLPRKYTFLERNRIISEISSLLLVAQASLKSGTISTANQSFKLGKRVLSIPFNLDHIQFQGTNLLIKKGAGVYLNPQSVLDFFNLNFTNVEESIKNLILTNSLDFVTIQERLGVSTQLLQKSLLELVLEGEIFFDGEKYYL